MNGNVASSSGISNASVSESLDDVSGFYFLNFRFQFDNCCHFEFYSYFNYFPMP